VYGRVAEYLARGDVEILHVKPWGDVIAMRGRALGLKNGVLVIRRELKPGGVLDGIGVKIERGFHALTCVAPGSTYVVHSYYDASGRPVGSYININSPAEIGRRIIYVDLLVDKAISAEGERVLDLEEAAAYAEYLPPAL